MPLDTSIANVGEYYSSHYLDSAFARDLKELISGWRQQGTQAPPRRVQALSVRYFSAKAAALEYDRPDQRWQDDELAGWHAHFLDALGYSELSPLDLPVAGRSAHVPTVHRINRYGKPWLVICETAFCLPDASLKDGMPSENPLEMWPVHLLPPAGGGREGGKSPASEDISFQQPQGGSCDRSQSSLKLFDGDWSRAIGRLLTEEDAPRWVLFLAGSQVLLLDQRTFSQGRYLAFDLDDAFGRKEKDTFEHIAAFLSAETLCPNGESDAVLHDRIEEQSHRFAHGVTDKLQEAVREAIYLLANEWVEDRRRRNLSMVSRRLKNEYLPGGTEEITAEDLRREALIFVYRLLFCFYAESRGGELGILPMSDEAYRYGYSLEALRDLELAPLTPSTEEGLYFQHHLKKLFGIIHEGFNPVSHISKQLQIPEGERVRAFSIQPLTATLFDPGSTPLLDNARLGNRCLQQVVRLLSLSRDDAAKSTGRVNYAELGIHQLGAVYEGLLSYRGMFAPEDMIQVKPAGSSFKDKKTPTWFVPRERLAEFHQDELQAIDENDLAHKPRIYPKGSFILHLSGIDREQSASYYTPEVLTQCLVEEALRELLKGFGPEDADRILALKICELSMGSGTFINETAEQLAARYLELKQKQTGKTIDPTRYRDELLRVKHYIITRNAYGVDLNDTAVQLGALSLWLGSIHRLLIQESINGEPDQFKPGATPWFGMRLRCGNSLIGARRQVWTTAQLKAGKHFGADSETPRLLKPGEPRQANEIYHFLVFDPDMAPAHRDSLMRQFWPLPCETVKSWQKTQVKTKWSQQELKLALTICDLVDLHWQRYSQERKAALEKTACTASVWPTPTNSQEALAPGPSLADQEKIRQGLESNSSSFQRLKLLMDTWCALWFWPLDRSDELPRRESFLAAASLLLGDTPGVMKMCTAEDI